MGVAGVCDNGCGGDTVVGRTTGRLQRGKGHPTCECDNAGAEYERRREATEVTFRVVLLDQPEGVGAALACRKGGRKGESECFGESSAAAASAELLESPRVGITEIIVPGEGTM
jgi:hypothetical protein